MRKILILALFIITIFAVSARSQGAWLVVAGEMKALADYSLHSAKDSLLEEVASFTAIRADAVSRFNMAMTELRDEDPEYFDEVMEKHKLRFENRQPD